MNINRQFKLQVQVLDVKFSVLGCFLFPLQFTVCYNQSKCDVVEILQCFKHQVNTLYVSAPSPEPRFYQTDLKCCSLVAVCEPLPWRLFCKHSCSRRHSFFSLSLPLFHSVSLSLPCTQTAAHILQLQQQKVLSGLKEAAVGFIIIPVWARTDS